MTLAIPRATRRSRFLLDWSAAAQVAAVGPALDALTGQPATYTRSSTATALDGAGRLQYLQHSQPRYEWVDLDGDGVRETVGLLLEGARTNSLKHASDLTQSVWTKYACTCAKNATGPDGVANSASTLTATGTADVLVEHSAGTQTMSAGVAQVMSGYLKAGTAAYACVADNGDAVTREAWIHLATGAVSAQHNCVVTTEALGDGWWRWTMSFTATNTHTPALRVFATSASGSTACTNGTTVRLFGHQVEVDRTAPSSHIPTAAAAVTRSADLLTFACNAPPQVLTLYLDLVQRAVPDPTVNQVYVALGNAAGDAPYLVGRLNATGVTLRALHHNGSALVFTDANPAASVGQRLEVMVSVDATGAITPTAAVAGGSATVGAATAANALAAAWSATTLLTVGAAGGGATPTLMVLRAVRLAAGVQTLATMRAG